MSNRAKELAAFNIVEGIPVRDWVNKPHGSFAKAVRESGIDKNFGLREGGVNENSSSSESEFRGIGVWKVKINYSFSDTDSQAFTVNAYDEDEAKDMAYNLFRKKYSVDDCDFESFGDVEKLCHGKIS